MLPRNRPTPALKHENDELPEARIRIRKEGPIISELAKIEILQEKPEKDVDDRATNTRGIEEGFNGVSAA